MTLPPLAPGDLEHVLAHTKALWATVRGRRILLTGGTGFFGAWLVESFAYANVRLGLGAELVVLTRNPSRARARLSVFTTDAAVSLHPGDVRHFLPPEGEFDVVIHGATESSHQGHPGDHAQMFETIVDGTRRALVAAEATGVRNFLLVSSGAVYGAQPASVTHITEDYSGGPLLSDPRSAYGEGKRAAEMMAVVEAARTGASVRIARCFAFVGPHLPTDAHFAIGNFIGDALAGRRIQIKGDGTALRSYLYTADLAVWLWTLALSPSASGAYNVGSEQAISILETARAVARACAPQLGIDVATPPAPGSVPHRYVPSTARAGRDVGLCQRVSLDDAIRRTAAWYRQN